MMKNETSVLRLLLFLAERTVWQCVNDDHGTDSGGTISEQCTCKACEAYRLTLQLKIELQ